MVSRPQRHGQDRLTPSAMCSDFDAASFQVTSFFSEERVHADTVAVEASTSRSRKMLASNAIWIGLWGPFSVSGAADRGRRMSLSKAKLHDCRAGPMPRRTERVTQAEV